VIETDHINCASCRARIREHEPDLVLRKLNGEELRFYHARPQCAAAAQQVILESPPEAWRLTHRYVSGVLN
jgi:hypothetical protein